MAKAIRQIRREIPNEQEEKAEDLNALLTEIAENREAISNVLKIIKGLNDMQMLEAITGIVENRTEVGAIAIQQLNQPSMHNVIKNGMGAVKFLGSLPPRQLETLMEGVSLGLKRVSEENSQTKEGFWQMRKRLRKPEIKATMTMMFDFLEGMGQALLKPKR